MAPITEDYTFAFQIPQVLRTRARALMHAPTFAEMTCIDGRAVPIAISGGLRSELVGRAALDAAESPS